MDALDVSDTDLVIEAQAFCPRTRTLLTLFVTDDAHGNTVYIETATNDN